MSLFDLFFPEQSTAMHLRKLALQQVQQQTQHSAAQHDGIVRAQATAEALKMRIDDLEADLGFTVLLLAGLLSTLDEKGVLTKQDVKRELQELDLVDGMRDGKLNVRVLRRYLAGLEP